MMGQQEAESYPTARMLIFLAALVVLLGQISLTISDEAQQAAKAIRFPFPLHYVEGVTLDQQQRANLDALYSTHITSAPFAITTSPPLYYLLTRVLGTTTPEFVPGRALSVAATVVAALLTGLICLALSQSVLGAVVGGAMLLMFPVVGYWGLLNTPEPLAFALGLAGLCALLWLDNAVGVVLAAVLIVLTAATSSSMAVTPWLTAVLWLLLQRRRRSAIALALAVPVCCAVGFVALNSITGGGFSLHAITASNRGYSLPLMLGYMFNILVRAIPMLVMSMAFFVVERLSEPARAPGADRTLAFLLTALVAGTLAGLVGTNMSATLMPAAAICVTMGVALDWLGRNRLVAVGLLVVMFVQLTPLESWREADFAPELQRRFNGTREASQLVTMFRDAGSAVLTDEYISILVMQGQRPYVYPLEFNELQQAGQWSDADLVDAIRRRQFKLIALYEPVTSDGQPLIRQRWPRAVLGAIRETYKQQTSVADAQIYVP